MRIKFFGWLTIVEERAYDIYNYELSQKGQKGLNQVEHWNL